MVTVQLLSVKKEIVYSLGVENMLCGSAVNDITILGCRGSLCNCKRCLSLHESLECVTEKFSRIKLKSSMEYLSFGLQTSSFFFVPAFKLNIYKYI